MNKNIQAVCDDASNLAQDARNLVTATADVANEKVSQARERLSAALDNGKEIYGRARDQVVKGAKAADEVVHDNPYKVIGIAVGIGLLLGYLCGTRHSSNSQE